MLVHTFVTSHVDYYNVSLAAAPKSINGPMAWNLLVNILCDLICSFDSFWHDSKTSFLTLLVYTMHDRLYDYALYKW